MDSKLIPCDVCELRDKSPHLPKSVKLLRVQMIDMLYHLAQNHSVKKIQKNVFIDVDEHDNIIGLDVTKITDVNTVHVMRRVPLAALDKDAWINMRLDANPKKSKCLLFGCF